MLSKDVNRRGFIQSTSALGVLSVIPGLHRSSNRPRIVSPGETTAFGPPDSDLMREVALRAVDVAKSEGATYADARIVRIVSQVTLSRTDWLVLGDLSVALFSQRHAVPQSVEVETHGIAVRALVNGAWGFAASPWWTLDEATRLAHDAVSQARDNAQWTKRRVELAPSSVTTGTWTTPYRIDPFSIPVEEKMAFVENALDAYRTPYRLLDRELNASGIGVSCQHTTRVVATSEGALFTQHFYDTRILQRRGWGRKTGMIQQGGHWTWTQNGGEANVFDAVVPHGTGWEAVLDADLWSWGKQAAELAYAKLLRPPAKGVDIGQYSVVLDAEMMAKVIDVTVTRATDFDRIVGNDTNAGGTSYLGSDPLALLGKYSFGTPLLNVTATRAATVGKLGGLPAAQWDDEGVPTAPFTLIKDGVLQDMATTRESAAHLAPYYQAHGRPVASHGCAMSGTAFDLTTVGPPTLVLSPGVQDVTVDAMVSSVPRGLVIRSGETGSVSTDFQCRQATIVGETQEIVNGRLGRPISGAAIVVDATQLWKNLMVLGGGSTQQAFEQAGQWEKGEPAQTMSSAVVAVPATFNNMPVVDATRRR